ncbi:MAG: universal stress protein [Chloroflexi bacterium]|nr:universal stress protein [Chloroflexota bacterium]
MKFLICDKGSEAADVAGRLGSALARLAGAEATHFRVSDGDPVEQILTESARGSFDLIVIGTRSGRGLAKLFLGSTSSRLAKQSSLPLLIAKGRRESVKRILICTGGERPGESCASWGGRVAAWTGASVTVLHVMSQLALARNAKLEDLQDSAEEAIAQSTREGQHLQKLMGLVREGGATGDVGPKIRHGLVLDEIIAEIEEGDYDLLVIGAHHPPTGDLWRRLLLDDVADQIIRECPRPVLVVRAK